MPRFTIKDLLIATTLIAIGCGMLAVLYQGTIVPPSGPSSSLSDVVIALIFLICIFGSGPFIGAGLFTPFKYPWIGAAVGLVFQFVLFTVLFFLAAYYD